MAVDYKNEISRSASILLKFRKSTKLFNDETAVLNLLQQRYEMLYAQIHEYLAPKKTKEAEEEIQEHIRNIFVLDLPICSAKVEKFKILVKEYDKKKIKDKETSEQYYKYLQEWLELYENNYALVAFRSFEHFSLFMEWEVPDSEKVWQPCLDPYKDGGYTSVCKPFFHYFGRMVIKKDIKFISKQMFTGGGKSRSNQFAFAWLLGIDKSNEILDVLGNPSLVLRNTLGTVELMVKPRYAKVFPTYQKYFDMGGDVRSNMFSVCRLKEGEITVEGSPKPVNLKVVSKETSVDGVRCRYLFLDDICASNDANNLSAHQRDIGKFWDMWYKRNYTTEDFYIVVSGTAYSVNDIMSHLIDYYSKGKMQRTKVSKYTFESIDGKCVFIKIPKIDIEFERSTFPSKFPYEEAVRARERNLSTFLAMEQQQPQNPETSPLCYDKIAIYEEIPEGLSDYALACLDPARTGKNYVAMTIKRVKKERDQYNTEIERHYFVDCIFQLKQMRDLYNEICDKVEKHHIIKLHVENNTDTSLKYLIEKMLHERGIFFCEVTESFSTENKDEKMREIVYANEGYFKNHLVYPAMGTFAPSSQMGKFMQYLTSYDYYKPLEYDDSIDVECMYIKSFIEKKTTQKSKARLLYV